MTTKEQILESLSRMRDDATYEQAIDRLMVMQKIEIGLKQLDEGKFVDHDELFDRLLHDEKKSETQVDRPGSARSARNKSPHRSSLSNNGRKVRSTAKKVRR